MPQVRAAFQLAAAMKLSGLEVHVDPDLGKFVAAASAVLNVSAALMCTSALHSH